MTMPSDKYISPKEMEAGRLAMLKETAVEAMVCGAGENPMIDAGEVHALLCHLAGREVVYHQAVSHLKMDHEKVMLDMSQDFMQKTDLIVTLQESLQVSAKRVAELETTDAAQAHEDALVQKDGVIAKLQSKDAESAQRISELETKLQEAEDEVGDGGFG